MDCFDFIQLTFGNISLKRDFKFASSHLEDLHNETYCEHIKTKYLLMGESMKEGGKIIILLIEKQESDSNLHSVPARTKTYTAKQLNYRLMKLCNYGQ